MVYSLHYLYVGDLWDNEWSSNFFDTFEEALEEFEKMKKYDVGLYEPLCITNSKDKIVCINVDSSYRTREKVGDIFKVYRDEVYHEERLYRNRRSRPRL